MQKHQAVTNLWGMVAHHKQQIEALRDQYERGFDVHVHKKHLTYLRLVLTALRNRNNVREAIEYMEARIDEVNHVFQPELQPEIDRCKGIITCLKKSKK